MNKTTWKSMTAAPLLGALLAACGGGGGSSGTAPAAAPAPVVPAPLAAAQGAYIGTTSDGREHDTLVLENDDFYTMYGHTVGSAFVVSGFLQGSGKSTNGSFSSSNVVDSTSTNLRVPATLSASYNPGVSFNGSLTESGGSVSFTGAAIQAAVFDYNAAAKLANISGAWNLTSLRGFSNALTIAANGSFTATSSGCTFSGSFTPRASGKNVFDVVMNFGPAPCQLPSQTIKGIALEYLLTSGQRQLIVAGIDITRLNSAAFFGVR